LQQVKLELLSQQQVQPLFLVFTPPIPVLYQLVSLIFCSIFSELNHSCTKKDLLFYVLYRIPESHGLLFQAWGER
jgi:hypothetical protein